jgi:pimeloyl-ACP methyl ester carboxylesterase
MSIKGRTLEIGGLGFNVDVEGEGPDVLLIHGFPDSNAVWRHQIPALVEGGFRVIAPDLRGFGETAMPPKKADYHIDRLVGDLIGILDALEVDKVRLVGHDWGSAICWHACLRHPERIDRYAALSVGHPSAYAHGGLRQKLKSWYILFFQLPWLSEKMVTAKDWWLWRRMMRYDPELPTWKKDLSRPGRLTAALNYYRANLGLVLPNKKWPNATMPVMGIWGEGDVATAERQMLESEKYVDGPWREERVEGGGHWSQLEAPAKVNALLLDFLADGAGDRPAQAGPT